MRHPYKPGLRDRRNKNEIHYDLFYCGIRDKINEITAIPSLLDLLDMEGSIITIHAIGKQTDITEKIIENKADYILSIKGNQKELWNKWNAVLSTKNRWIRTR